MGDRAVDYYGIGMAMMSWTAFVVYADGKAEYVSVGHRNLGGAQKACKDHGGKIKWDEHIDANGHLRGHLVKKAAIRKATEPAEEVQE